MDCFSAQLAALVHPGCLNRLAFRTPSTIPYYGLNARRLTQRRRHLETQLRLAGASDVTLVHCADADAVAALPASKFRCIHPHTTPTLHSGQNMTVGTISLALKHMIAMKDMLDRRRPLAVVLEDDAMLLPNFAAALHSLLAGVPADAHIVHLGSYSRCRQRFGQELRLPLATARSHMHAQGRSAKCDGCVYRRSNMTGIVGTVGQVYFPRGAHRLIGPIVAPADVLFTLQRPPINAPSPTYGPGEYLVWPAPIEMGLEAATHSATVVPDAAPEAHGEGATKSRLKARLEAAAREGRANAIAQASMNCTQVRRAMFLRRREVRSLSAAHVARARAKARP